MLLTSMIVKVAPSKAMEVSRLLGHIPKLAVYGVHRGGNIIAIAEAENAAELKKLYQMITGKFSDVLGIFQTNEVPEYN